MPAPCAETDMHYDMDQRRAGVLLHPTSLPSGTLDDAAAWLEFMQQSGLSIWQVLPLGVPQIDRSPYQCLSAFATNPALLSRIPDFDATDPGFSDYCRAEQHWLDDYALFIAIRRQQQNQPWYQWPDALKWRQPEALRQIRSNLRPALQRTCWEQYQLHKSWQRMRRQAQQKDIHLFGDMPIFVAYDSADVWACPQRFLLDEQGQPEWVTGVPPDYFSATGQRWGNPHYDWDYQEQEGFRWWLDRLHHHFKWFDLVRIDHFRGLQAVWMIAADEETAVNGHWQEVPGDKLLAMLQQEMGALPLVAEDLGLITDEVRKLKKKYALPGMAILQFGFDAFDDNPHKPANIEPDTVVYTGTHDNDTTLGWYQSLAPDTQQYVRQTLGLSADDDIVDAMIRVAFDCAANLAIIPMQDFLKLDSSARMNIPGTTEGNWQWQFQWQQLRQTHVSQTLRPLISSSKRTGQP